MTSLILLLVIVAVYVFLRRISEKSERVTAFRFPLIQGKVELNSVFDIACLLYSRGEELRGLRNDEIADIEKAFKISLPFAYREFLKYMGRRAGTFMLGSSVFIDELYDLRQGTMELCEENGIPHIPENAYVFWMHQGYEALYFIPEDGVDDPDIYYFTEDGNKKKFERTGDTFTGFLKTQIVMHYPELKEKLSLTSQPGNNTSILFFSIIF